MFKNKQTSRLLCLLLALCLLPLNACSETKAEETPADTAAESESNPNAETDAQPVEEVIEEPVFDTADYGGRDFTIFAAKDFVSEMYAEEQTGSAANDVIYSRNLTVEDFYNVKIALQEGDSNNANDFPALIKMVTAGETGIDLTDIHVYKAHNLILNDCLVNWYDVPGMDLSNPWWLTESNEASTLNGKLFAAGGALNLSSLTHDWCMFYNPVFLENVGIGVTSLQETVISGQWTLDTMTSLVKDVYVDVNADGNRTLDDQYGFIAFWSTLDPMFTAAGMDMTARDGDGNLVITFMSEKIVDVYAKWYSLIFRQQGVFPAPESWQTTIDAFLDGRGMIVPGVVNWAYQLADMEDGFGIIPYPKWDEAQEKYYTMPVDSASILCILKTADLSDNRIGNVLELLNYYSQRDVFPTYYDVLLKGRYSLDKNTAAIIDLFIPNVKYEFAVQFSENNGPPLYRLSYFMRDMVKLQNEDLVSAFTKLQRQIDKGVEKIAEHYQ